MKADFPAIWAEAPSSLRREPTNGELASGFPCGPLDLQLWNELTYRLAQAYAEISYAISSSGQTASAANRQQLWAAILKAVADGAPPESLAHRGTDSGTANALVINDVTPAVTSLASLVLLSVDRTFPNTGSSTIKVGSLPAKSAVRQDGSALKGGDLPVGRSFVSYDGTNFVLLTGLSTAVTNYINLLTPNGQNEIRAFTPGLSASDISPVPGVTVVQQTANFTGATYLDAFGSCAFANQDNTGTTIGFTARIRLVDVTAGGTFVDGDYQGAQDSLGGNKIQIPVSFPHRWKNLDPTHTYALQNVAQKSVANGPIKVQDATIKAFTNGA